MSLNGVVLDVQNFQKFGLCTAALRVIDGDVSDTIIANNQSCDLPRHHRLHDRASPSREC